jgi:Na+/serine symporter
VTTLFEKRPTKVTSPWLRLLIAAAFLIFGRIYYGSIGAIVPPIIFLTLDFVSERFAKQRNDIRIFFLGRLGAVFIALIAPVIVSIVWDAMSVWRCERSHNCNVVPITVKK